MNTFLIIYCTKKELLLAEFFLDEESKISLLRKKTIPYPSSKNVYHEITQELRDIATFWNLKQTSVYVLFSSDAVFVQEIRLTIPKQLEASLDKIISLEAEQVIPVPLKNVLWDYQIISCSEKTVSSESFKVTYAALKKNASLLCEAIEKGGFIIQSINAPPQEFLRAFFSTSITSDHNPMPFRVAVEEISLIPEKISLLSTSLINIRKRKRFLPYLFSFTAILPLILTGGLFFLTYLSTKTSQKIDHLTFLLNKQREEWIAWNSEKEKLSQIKKSEKELQNLITLQKTWPLLFQEIERAQPPRYLWITKLSPVFNKKEKSLSDKAPFIISAITIEGLYLENPHQEEILNDFIQGLQQSPLFALKKIAAEKIITSRETPNNDHVAYRFALLLPLQQPIQELPLQ